MVIKGLDWHLTLVAKVAEGSRDGVVEGSDENA
jgi:hypothetical protein